MHIYAYNTRIPIIDYLCVCVCVCFFWEREGGWGTPHMHEHKESYKDLNLKILTEWDLITST